ncbi:hypothetical protein V866_000893 [Kwoniella sp. B9012]
MPSPPPQPVPAPKQRTSNPHGGLNAPQSIRMGASPMSYGAMTGISFTNGGGFSFENKPRSVKWGNTTGSGPMGSYGARFYGDAGGDSPTIPFSTSITMEPSSFAASAHAFNLPSGSMSSSYHRRSYAAVASSIPRGGDYNLSNSFASMSFQPMSLGTSYSKSQVTNMMRNKPRSDAELTQAYECCGKTHAGLHALLEHVEDVHPFSDPNIPPDNTNNNHNNPGGFSPVTNAMDLDLDDVEEELPSKNKASTTSARSSISPNLTNAVPVPSYPLPTSGSKATTPTEQASIGKSPLKLSDVLKSPPELESSLTANANASLLGNKASNLTLTRTGSSGSSPPEGSLATPTTSTQPSPVFAQPKINPARQSFLGSTGAGSRPAAQQMRFDRAFNEVVAGPKTTTATTAGDANSTVPTAVAPGVLFASAVSSLGIPTIPPNQQKQNGQNTTNATTNGVTTPQEEIPEGATTGSGNTTPNKNANGISMNDIQLPQPSLFSSSRPWRCPNPGCNKSYKQSNGLKYHQMKGQCDFAIHDAVDLGLSLEEAEERNRPYVCAVGAGCNKRYRQMNGLKYHYLNSGEHGQYGLRMLQNGTHPLPPNMPPSSNTSTPNATPQKPSAAGRPISSTTSTARAGAPYAIPSHANANSTTQNRNGVGAGGHGLPRMGTWPAQRTVNGNATAQRPPQQQQQQQGIPVKTQPKPQPPPITKGRDAVLFAAVGGGEDPMDVIGRMDQ